MKDAHNFFLQYFCEPSGTINKIPCIFIIMSVYLLMRFEREIRCSKTHIDKIPSKMRASKTGTEIGWQRNWSAHGVLGRLP